MSSTTKSILLTKPKGQNTELKTELNKLGFSVDVLACVEIEKIDFKIPQITSNNVVLFTSQNAARCFDSNVKGSVFAIGPATQRALEAKNIKATTPAQFSSEGLLKLDALRNVKNKTIFIIGGENPRPLLAKTLSARGATVEAVYCYRRIQPNYPIETIERIAQQNFDLIISTSMESLKNLNEILTRHTDWLHAQSLLVISDKMKALAIELGFSSRIIVSKNAVNESIVDSLTTLYNRG